MPSRSNIASYRALQRQLATQVGEINGRHGDIDWTPVRYLNKGFCQATLAGFYRTAAIGLVTPLQDGMNLVAKEYVAAQNPADPGVLVLSDSPAPRRSSTPRCWSIRRTSGHRPPHRQGLAMPFEERRARWQQMMDALLRHSIHAWFTGFMQALKVPAPATSFRWSRRRRRPCMLPPLRDPAWAAHP